MRVRMRAAAVCAVLVAMTACSNPLGRRYEYEEQLYLDLSGSATVIVDASVAALVALRAARLDPDPAARIDQEGVRRLFASSGCDVVRVGQPWRVDGRRFIQVRLQAADVQALSRCSLLAWSSYSLAHDADGNFSYEQKVGASTSGTLPSVNWDGSEVVAFKLHLPSRILFQNVRRLDNGEPGSTERGNILTWEQTLADRRAGKPIDIQVRLAPQSILYQTLWIFAGSFVAAVIVLGAIIWWTVRRGRRKANPFAPAVH
jgi:hypothetical protein